MRLLLVTPTLGRSPWFDDTVASVARLGPQVMHVVVAPPSALPELRRRAGSARVVPDPGGGMYAALNAAFATMPDWDLGGYINDDDSLAPGFSAVIDAGADGSCDIAYGGVSYVNEAGRVLGRLPLARPSEVGAVLATGRAPFTQQGTLFNRALWMQLGGFDTRWRLAADCDFWCRAVLNGARFGRVGATAALFRLHGAQLSGNRLAMEKEIAEIHRLHRESLRAHASRRALLTFRLRALVCVLERRRLAGVWTSRGLYARYSTGS